MQVFKITALLGKALGLAAIPATLVHAERTTRAVAAALDGLKAEAQPADVILARRWSGVERPLSANQEQMYLIRYLVRCLLACPLCPCR